MLVCNIQSVKNLAVHSKQHNNVDIQQDQFAGLLGGCKACKNAQSSRVFGMQYSIG